MSRKIKCDECGLEKGLAMSADFLAVGEDTDYCQSCVVKMIDGYRKYTLNLRVKAGDHP